MGKSEVREWAEEEAEAQVGRSSASTIDMI